jgi:hypothetical protein
MALDFPATPTLNQQFTGPNGVVWSWDGAKWISGSSTATIYAPINSPIFTGDPTAPTPALNDSDTSVATTAYVQGQASSTTPLMDGTATIGNATTWARANHIHPTDSTRAALASPTFTGDPKAPTPAAGDNDTSIATTAFVATATTVGAGLNTGRNLIHNALFNVQQRGAGPWTANLAYTVDRWRIDRNLDTMTVTASVLTDTHRAQIGDEEARYALTCVFTGNATAPAYSSVSHMIENVRRLANDTLTVSFYASASAALKLGLSLTQWFGTGGSPSAPVVSAGKNVTLSTTWARYSLTFTVPSIAGKVIGTANDDNTIFNFWYSSGTDNGGQAGTIGIQSGTINIWGVQMEQGSTATPLEKLDATTQLQQCQRFYVVSTQYLAGSGTASVTVGHSVTLPVTMRVPPPTVTWATLGSSNIGTVTAQNDSSSSVLFLAPATTTAGFAMHGTYTATADL